jgi:arylformamidase
MTTLIDISVPLEEGMVTWPESTGFHISWSKRIADGHISNNSRIDSDVHMGTHIDLPLHFLRDGTSAEHASLEDLVGPAYVVELPNAEVITAADLEQASIPPTTERLLLHTRNSLLWASERKGFVTDYTALKADAAEWIIDRKIRAVGIDYISIQCYSDGPEVHHILLAAGVSIIEGLNLHGVNEGIYDLICLPLLIVGAEGAPARAVLRQMQ